MAVSAVGYFLGMRLLTIALTFGPSRSNYAVPVTYTIFFFIKLPPEILHSENYTLVTQEWTPWQEILKRIRRKLRESYVRGLAKSQRYIGRLSVHDKVFSPFYAISGSFVFAVPDTAYVVFPIYWYHVFSPLY